MTAKYLNFTHRSPVHEDLLKRDIEINSLRGTIESMKSRMSEKDNRVKKLENQLAHYKKQNKLLLWKLNGSELQNSLSDGVNVHKN